MLRTKDINKASMTTLTNEQIKESFTRRAVEDYIGKVYAVEKEISDAAVREW